MGITSLALLRGINVGGKNKIAMQSLRDLFVEAGCTDVRTYIQSGNVLFRAEPNTLAGLPALLHARIAEQFGFRSPVILRTREELHNVVHHNPFLQSGVPENLLHVLFLADTPTSEQFARLDPHRSAPDAFVVRGQEVYLHLPNGAADTKLTNAYFDSKLGTISTGRNWRTVTTLLTMIDPA